MSVGSPNDKSSSCTVVSYYSTLSDTVDIGFSEHTPNPKTRWSVRLGVEDTAHVPSRRGS